MPDIRVVADVHAFESLDMGIGKKCSTLEPARTEWQGPFCILQHGKRCRFCGYLVCAAENKPGFWTHDICPAKAGPAERYAIPVRPKLAWTSVATNRVSLSLSRTASLISTIFSKNLPDLSSWDVSVLPFADRTMNPFIGPFAWNSILLSSRSIPTIFLNPSDAPAMLCVLTGAG